MEFFTTQQRIIPAYTTGQKAGTVQVETVNHFSAVTDMPHMTLLPWMSTGAT